MPAGLTSSAGVYAAAAGGGVLVDVDGNSFIDLGSGIAVTTVGNSAPHVVARASDQLARYTHTCFLATPYEPYIEVAETLNRITPGDHEKRTALFNTGSEALENAVKYARAATGRPAVVVFDHAFHGRTLLTMTMTAKNQPYKHGFGPFAPEVYRAPMAYPYRWPSGPANCAAEAFSQFAQLGRLPDRRRLRGVRGGRTHSGGRWLHRPRRRLPTASGRLLPRSRHPAGRRRGPDRDRPHRSVVRL